MKKMVVCGQNLLRVANATTHSPMWKATKPCIHRSLQSTAWPNASIFSQSVFGPVLLAMVHGVIGVGNAGRRAAPLPGELEHALL